VLRQHVDHAVGSIERPLTDAGLENKLRDLAEDVLTSSQIRELIARVWSLDQIGEASALARACQSKP
jgi:hypothetical protein